MRIVNNTAYSIRNIRRMAHRILPEILPAVKIRGLVIRLDYMTYKHQSTLGRATYFGWVIQLYLPKPEWYRPPCPIQVAHTIAHEAGHIKGLRHPEMKGIWRYDWTPDWHVHYAWAKQYPVLPQKRASEKLEQAASRRRKEPHALPSV